MECYFVVSTQDLTDDVLRPLVTQWGGHWPPDWGYGVVQRGEARIEVYSDELADYSPEELALLKEMLSAAPVSGVSVAYRSNDESELLAKQFCKGVIDRFGGYFDDNFTDLIPEPAR